MLQEMVKGSCAQQVKEATASLHQAAEDVIMPLLHRATTPEHYGHLLRGFYGFYRPMEPLLEPYAIELALPGGAFRRSHLILEDLESLLQRSPENWCTTLPAIDNAMQALGALYVLEGASLGGRIIARMLQATDTLPQKAFRFFEGNGAETANHWKQFIHTLNGHAQTQEEIDAVCAAACATFSAHSRWMQTL